MDDYCGKNVVKAQCKHATPTKNTNEEYRCKYCGKEFSKKIDMVVHRLTHSDIDENDKDRSDDDTKGYFSDASVDDINMDDTLAINQALRDFMQVAANSNMLSDEIMDHPKYNGEKYQLDVLISSEDNMFVCESCNEQFNDYESYLNHRKDHSKSKLFSCRICSKTFTTKGNMSRHELIHSNIRPFKCSICEQKFSQKTHLVGHMGVHSRCKKRKQYKCKICMAMFEREYSLMKHKLVHMTEDQKAPEDALDNLQKAVNEIGSESSSTHWTVESHASGIALLNKNIERSPEVDKFEIAPKDLDGNSTDLVNTSSLVGGAGSEQHSKTVSENLTAANQSRDSEERKEILSQNKQYLQNKYGPDGYCIDRTYRCGTCQAIFPNFGLYTIHKKEHPTLKSFSCETCGKSFSAKGNLQRHLQIHEDIRLHECSICSKRFSQKTHLEAHSLVHSKERPYICPICGVTFARDGNLRRHIKTHSAPEPPSAHRAAEFRVHRCDQCLRTFTRKGNLVRHLKLHS